MVRNCSHFRGIQHQHLLLPEDEQTTIWTTRRIGSKIHPLNNEAGRDSNDKAGGDFILTDTKIVLNTEFMGYFDFETNFIIVTSAGGCRLEGSCLNNSENRSNAINFQAGNIKKNSRISQQSNHCRDKLLQWEISPVH